MLHPQSFQQILSHSPGARRVINRAVTRGPRANAARFIAELGNVIKTRSRSALDDPILL